MVDAVSGTATTTATTGTAGLYTNSVANRDPKQTLDSSVFMQLLVTQLRNQDPSSPMDTNQMIQQTTQLSMMEKMTELGTTSTEDFALQMRIAASAIVGKQVSYANSDGTTVTGIATSVSFAGTVPQVRVGSTDIALDKLTGITATS